MGDYNEELHHRQQTGDVGNAVLGDIRSGGAGRKWKAFRLPVAMIVIGVPVAYVGPLPGLGVLLILGGMMALPIITLAALLKN